LAIFPPADNNVDKSPSRRSVRTLLCPPSDFAWLITQHPTTLHDNNNKNNNNQMSECRRPLSPPIPLACHDEKSAWPKGKEYDMTVREAGGLARLLTRRILWTEHTCSLRTDRSSMVVLNWLMMAAS
jgi:hypothetical protein